MIKTERGIDYKRAREIEAIISALNNGMPPEEIDEVVAQKRAERDDEVQRLGELIGYESEKRVAECLLELSCVADVLLYEHNSLQDRRGLDLRVALMEEDIPESERLGDVFCQVKSSHKGIYDFRNHMAIMYHISLAGVQILLQDQRLIIINGQKKKESIQESFMEQLAEMRDYWDIITGR